MGKVWGTTRDQDGSTAAALPLPASDARVRGRGGTLPAAALGPILVLGVLCAANHHLSLLDTAWVNPCEAPRSHGPVFSPSPWVEPCSGSPFAGAASASAPRKRFPGPDTLLGSSTWKVSTRSSQNLEPAPGNPSPPAQLCSLRVSLQRPRPAAMKSPATLLPLGQGASLLSPNPAWGRRG